jgi:hypothetical protein
MEETMPAGKSFVDLGKQSTSVERTIILPDLMLQMKVIEQVSTL